MKDRRRIGVIGGGIGGLVCAARLAHAGYDVDLYEKNPSTGGKMGRIEFDGCTFDTGPSLITMPFVLDDFFRDMGTTPEDELTLQQVDPACHYRWMDGTRLDMPFDLDAVAGAIGSIAPLDGQNVRSYLREAQFIYEATKEVFIFKPFDGFLEFVKPTNLHLLLALPRLRFSKTLHEVHKRFFNDERVVQLFDRFATYNGSSPYLAPATLMVIPWVEFGFGAWYPQGGVYSIAEAVTRVAERVGVRIHTGVEVTSITTAHGRVTGLQFADGTSKSFDRVVSNMDVRTTRTRLLGEDLPDARDLSSSGFVLLLSVDKADHGLAHHNVLFSSEYQREFEDIFTHRILPRNMTVYIARSAASDSTQAPSDRENWFVLVNAPPGVTITEDERDRYADAILRQMERFNVSPSIRQMQIRTSDDMAREWNAEGGALYGRSSNSMFSAFLRQRQRSSRVRDLWYVGGSAHPGGGVPLVAISGSIAARLIQNEDQ